MNISSSVVLMNNYTKYMYNVSLNLQLNSNVISSIMIYIMLMTYTCYSVNVISRVRKYFTICTLQVTAPSNHSNIYTCDVLKGATATGQTMNCVRAVFPPRLDVSGAVGLNAWRTLQPDRYGCQSPPICAINFGSGW